jgi:hypothetical protein
MKLDHTTHVVRPTSVVFEFGYPDASYSLPLLNLHCCPWSLCLGHKRESETHLDKILCIDRK